MKNIDFWLNIGILLMIMLGINLVRTNGGLLPDLSSDWYESEAHLNHQE